MFERHFPTTSRLQVHLSTGIGGCIGHQELQFMLRSLSPGRTAVVEYTTSAGGVGGKTRGESMNPQGGEVNEVNEVKDDDDDDDDDDEDDDDV